MARRTCASVGADGKPCGALAKKGSDYCRHHSGTETGRPRFWIDPEGVPRRATVEEAAKLDWYVSFLDQLGYKTENHDEHHRALQEPFLPALWDTCITWNGRTLPGAVFLTMSSPDTISLRVCKEVYRALGFDPDGFVGEPEALSQLISNVEQLSPADRNQWVTRAALHGGHVKGVTATFGPKGEVSWAQSVDQRKGTPFILFAVLWAQIIVSGHPSIPRDKETGLPDLRALWAPRPGWQALGPPPRSALGANGTAAYPLAPIERPMPLPELLKFQADRIHKGAVEAFSLVDQWERCDGFYRAYEVGGRQKDFAMLCGLPHDTGADVWGFLMSHGAAAIKAHYALWARLYEQTGAEPGRYAVMNINQFCADLGYQKHKRGGFKPERKREAMRILETLTTVEVAARFRVVGKKDRIREISGSLWKRGFRARERDTYGDLFGQVREGDPELWEPSGFTFGPGPWFDDPDWRRQNRFLGLIGAGLMRLQTDQDQAAIRIGGYLGTLARFEQYRTRRVRVDTLLHQIGMANRYRDNPGVLQKRVEAAFDKLIEVGIIARWDYTDADPSEPDMDNPGDLAALADYKVVRWGRKTIEVEWPEAMLAENERLEQAQRKAIAKANRHRNGTAKEKPDDSS